MAVLWGGLLHSSLTPTPLTHPSSSSVFCQLSSQEDGGSRKHGQSPGRGERRSLPGNSGPRSSVFCKQPRQEDGGSRSCDQSPGQGRQRSLSGNSWPGSSVFCRRGTKVAGGATAQWSGSLTNPKEKFKMRKTKLDLMVEMLIFFTNDQL